MAKQKLLNLQDFPEYAAASTRLLELHRQRNALAEQLESLHKSVEGTTHSATLISREAAALTTAPPDELAKLNEHWEAIDAAEKRLVVLAEAIERQTEIVATKEDDAAQLIRKAIQPEQRSLVSGIAAKIRELQEALKAERTFRSHYEIQVGGLHNPTINGFDNSCNHWFREMNQLGLID